MIVGVGVGVDGAAARLYARVERGVYVPRARTKGTERVTRVQYPSTRYHQASRYTEAAAPSSDLRSRGKSVGGAQSTLSQYTVSPRTKRGIVGTRFIVYGTCGTAMFTNTTPGTSSFPVIRANATPRLPTATWSLRLHWPPIPNRDSRLFKRLRASFRLFRAFSFARFYARNHPASLIYRFRMVWLFGISFCDSAISWFCGARFEYLDRHSISAVANSEAAGEAEKCVKLHRYNFETTCTRLKICDAVARIIQSTLIVCLTSGLECDIIFLCFIILESKEEWHSLYRSGSIVEFWLRVEEAVFPLYSLGFRRYSG